MNLAKLVNPRNISRSRAPISILSARSMHRHSRRLQRVQAERSSTSSLTHPAMFTARALQHAVHLSFEMLNPFESVRDQFRDYGVQFEQAIALAPSNPAFASHANALVLMPTASYSSMKLHFNHAIERISAAVIGVRHISLIALDEQDDVVARQSVYVGRSLHHNGDLVEPLPCLTLDVTGDRIRQVVLMSDAPFVVNDLSFIEDGDPSCKSR